METKKCKKCGIERPIEAFYRHKKMADGHLNTCPSCTVAINRKYRKNYKRPPEQRRAHRQLYDRKYPEKVLARSVVTNAKRKGQLVPGPCEVCGAPKTEAHHDDYGKPLDVRWLCRTHHLEHHARISGHTIHTTAEGEQNGLS